ncbi:MAG: hypothetical protein Q9222_002805 [Ikaeria aurantiellina]
MASILTGERYIMEFAQRIRGIVSTQTLMLVLIDFLSALESFLAETFRYFRDRYFEEDVDTSVNQDTREMQLKWYIAIKCHCDRLPRVDYIHYRKQ